MESFRVNNICCLQPPFNEQPFKIYFTNNTFDAASVAAGTTPSFRRMILYVQGSELLAAVVRERATERFYYIAVKKLHEKQRFLRGSCGGYSRKMGDEMLFGGVK